MRYRPVESAPNLARAFFALWYLGGSIVHIRCGLTNPQIIYAQFGRTSLLPSVRQLWASLIMPHIAFFALLLAAFELATAFLLLNKGKAVRVGLVASILFNLFLVQLGLGRTDVSWGMDFLANRLPTLLFALLQTPLFMFAFPQSWLELLQNRAP